MTNRRNLNQFFFPRPPHFSKFILMLLSVKTQLTSDNKFFKYITSKCLFSKSDVLILSDSKIGYKDWRIGWLSCNVDVDEDVDVDFEKLDGIYLQIVGIDARLFSAN